jgi:hypothetical protein
MRRCWLCMMAMACQTVVAAADVPRYGWAPVTLKAPFAPRDGAGVLTFNGRMYLLDGWPSRASTHCGEPLRRELGTHGLRPETWALRRFPNPLSFERYPPCSTRLASASRSINPSSRA